jgi:hypothetical protein
MQIRCCTLRHYLFALFIGAGRRRIIERRPVNPLFKNAFPGTAEQQASKGRPEKREPKDVWRCRREVLLYLCSRLREMWVARRITNKREKQ